MTSKIEIFDQNIAHFGSFEGSFLTILGVEKVIFWTFSKLFWSCLGCVWALFSALKGLLLGVFWASKVDKWAWKLRFCVKILLILADLRGHFWPFWGVKKVDFWTFSKLFWSCLGSFWALFSALKGSLSGVFSAPKTHNWCSPLGSRSALLNASAASLVIHPIQYVKQMHRRP